MEINVDIMNHVGRVSLISCIYRELFGSLAQVFGNMFSCTRFGCVLYLS